MKFEMKLKENVALYLEEIILSPNDFIEFEEIFDSIDSYEVFDFLEEHSGLSISGHATYYVDQYEWLVAGEEDVFILRVLKGGI